MLEIAFDKNDNDEFLNQKRPVVEIFNQNPQSFCEYRNFAVEVLEKYSDEQIVLIKNNCKLFSSNLFAVALFVQSCLTETKTECVVFKTKNYESELKSYKPYVALTIALKYAIRLYNLPLKQAYKEIANMSYLGIDIKKDYENKLILMTLNDKTEKIEMKATTLEQAIVAVSCLKAYSLLKTGDAFATKIAVKDRDENVNINEVINQIVKNVVGFVDRQ